MQFLIFGIDIKETFLNLIRLLGIEICKLIYKLIALLYELFEVVSSANILSNSDVEPIYNRMTILLTVIMTFYITLEVVKYTINPDTFSDKEKGAGGLLKRIGIVIFLIAFTPEIFTIAYRIQNNIISNETIPKLILGKDSNSNSNPGRELSANVFSIFYNINPDLCLTTSPEKDCKKVQKTIDDNINELKENGKTKKFDDGLDKNEKKDDKIEYYINFEGIQAIIVGGIILYILVLYCVDVGTRWAQLLFLQIIAPIPIISYLSPKKDGMFSKWLKQCVTTYIDIFIRIAIISFIIGICQILKNPADIITKSLVSDDLKVLAYIVMIIGLLVFAQRAPKLLSDLFPSLGNAGIGFGLKNESRNKGIKGFWRTTGAAAGAAIGGAAGAVTGGLQGMRASRNKKVKMALLGAGKGLVGGTTRGLYNGSKQYKNISDYGKNITSGMNKQIQKNKEYGNRAENDYTIRDQIQDFTSKTFGFASRIEKLENKNAPLKRKQDILKNTATSNDDMVKESLSQIEKGVAKNSGRVNEAKAELKRLQEDPKEKAKYTVGKYQNQADADTAYQTAVDNARMSVSKENFKTYSKTFDKMAYDTAIATEKARLMSVPGTSEAEAETKAKSKIKQTDYTRNIVSYDMKAYKAEQDRQAAQVDKSEFTVSQYQTAEEANTAYQEALQKASQKVKNETDIAVWQFISEGNSKIENIKREYLTNLKNYNAHASEECKLPQEFIEAVFNKQPGDSDDGDNIGKRIDALIKSKGAEYHKLDADNNDHVYTIAYQTYTDDNGILQYNLDELGNRKIQTVEVTNEPDPTDPTKTVKVYTTTDGTGTKIEKSKLKFYGINDDISAISEAISTNNSEIEAIKREQSGSGFDSGGKK